MFRRKDGVKRRECAAVGSVPRRNGELGGMP
jgi:hypothetical protein